MIKDTGFPEEAAERLGADLIVVPHSINEMLLPPYEAGIYLPEK